MAFARRVAELLLAVYVGLNAFWVFVATPHSERRVVARAYWDGTVWRAGRGRDRDAPAIQLIERRDFDPLLLSGMETRTLYPAFRMFRAQTIPLSHDAFAALETDLQAQARYMPDGWPGPRGRSHVMRLSRCVTPADR